MRFRQFYSKLYFRVSIDLIGWPKQGTSGGAVSTTAPSFFGSITENQQRAYSRWTAIEKRLKENYTFTLEDSKIIGEVNGNQPTKIEWLISIENNRVPEYPDRYDSRFNLTGVSAIKRCVEDALSETFKEGDMIVEAPYTLEQLIDYDRVQVNAILIP
jgi:hypothetical protein